MHIDSRNPIIVNILQNICKIVQHNGGRFHPNMQIRHEGERLWISCDREDDNAELMLIPDALFIPVTQLAWRERNGTLAYIGNVSSLSPVQQLLLDAMVELYNETGKLERVGNLLPTHLLHSDSAVLRWLQTARPEFMLPEDNPAYLFIETRLNEKNKWDGGDDQTGYLMPIIDMLNHHPDAEPYHRNKSGDWWLPASQPIKGSDECFLRYGKLDRLSMAIWHGYCDSNIRFLASVDCVFHHSNLGDIRIIGTNAAKRKVSAPRIFHEQESLTLQDIVLEKDQLHALRILLGLAVRSKRRDLAQPEAEVIADELVDLLIDANIQKYSELLTLCQTEPENFPLRPLFGQVAEHQLALLYDLRAS